MWDFWFTKHHDTYHLFYLQASRSLRNPQKRHDNASIGHASSPDLVNWTELGTVLEPGYAKEWDDVSTWTGSVIEHDSRWWMFYTGRSSLEGGHEQRIGAAISGDLNFWVKHPGNPLLVTHPFWYEHLDNKKWPNVAWRDPWLYAVDDGFEMLLTARVNTGSRDGRGVVARAFSSDLTLWTALPPLTVPGGFGEMEVPQRIDTPHGRLLLFSCESKNLASGRTAGLSDCYVMRLDESGGPFPADTAQSLDLPGHYAARAIEGPSGDWVVLAFELQDADGDFGGRISDPIPLAAVLPESLRG